MICLLFREKMAHGRNGLVSRNRADVFIEGFAFAFERSRESGKLTFRILVFHNGPQAERDRANLQGISPRLQADLGTHLTLWAPGCTLVVCAYVVAISVRT